MVQKLLVLFLFPVLIFGQIFGYLSFEEYCDMSEKIEKLIAKQAKYVDRFAQLPLVEKEQNISLLTDAVQCCEKGLALCEKLLKKIHEKSKKERKNILWTEAKQEQHQFRDALRAQMAFLQKYIEQATTDIPCLIKVENLYTESQKFAQLAEAKAKTCPMLTESNLEAFLQIMLEINHLFENALRPAKSALAVLQSMKSDLQTDKANIMAQIKTYEEQIATCQANIELCQTYIASKMQEAS